QGGDVEKAREVFNRVLPLLNFESLYSVNAYKEVLRRRGVIRCAYVRASTVRGLDESDMEELGMILADLGDLFAVASV
ncbi:MAG: dihydrodipicolinate synthase family protein, partial [bacterium]|nr:dihydrodipicolinate synthase family protein [bacterium]